MADTTEGSSPKKARLDSPKKARIAVCGAGWWTQGWHLPHLHRNPESEIAAIVEPNPAPKNVEGESLTTDQLHKLYGAPIFRSMDELLASEVAKTVDGVIICTSHASHHELGMKAMKAEWHVLIEKPMTTDPLEAFELTKVASSYGKACMVNNSANFRGQAKRAHDLVRAGQIGEVKHVSCALFSPLGWLFHNPNNKGWVKPTGKMLGNGFAWGQLSHTFAWVYLVTGLTPKSVFCHMSYSDKSGADVYDSATIRCTNGATISVQGAGDIAGPCKKVDNKILGTEGMLIFSGDLVESMAEGKTSAASDGLLLIRHDNKNQTFPGFEFENFEKEGNGPESVQALVSACLGRPFFNAADAEVGCKSVVSIEAMYRSAKLGQEVEVATATSA
eukprot:TRINITY_DN22213_c0_g1_i1.p1 TRINITY_DN22213_c0_g1~~TRINITY_DN22213_c0_g1_i1.p1  ORF type:complete len:389 (-),score=54.60 TRINITY_DN22213_c0_g1_i1:49-1215(-)